jgi:hypothetical protein
MARHKAFTVSENDNPLNRAGLEWLKEAKAPAPDHYMHLLNLAHWGLETENAVRGDWPDKNRYALREQVNLLLGRKRADVMDWLFSNPESEVDPKDQQADLLRLLETTSSPERAAAHVLSAIYSRLVSQCQDLQHAASELS